MAISRTRGDVEHMREEAIEEGIQMLRMEFKEYADIGKCPLSDEVHVDLDNYRCACRCLGRITTAKTKI
jgi:hypothetical protein